MNPEQAILERLNSCGNPIVEGGLAHLYWRGERPPMLRGDHTGWEEEQAVSLVQVGSRLWVHQAELPGDSYIEYAFFRGARRIRDPFNPRRTPNGLGNFNHYFHMPEYRPSTWHHAVDGIPRGEVSEHTLPAAPYLAGNDRLVFLYRPPAAQPTPLIVVYDGQEYLERAHLPVILDNLIAAGKIQPIALAMICNSKRYRVMEYSCADATLLFLLEVLLPFARQKLNLIDVKTHPGSYGILGASFGGLMALYSLLRLPNVFGRGLCQAGGYSVNGFDFPVWDLLETIRGADVRIWMDCGRFDFLIDANRRMASALSDLAIPFHFHETNAGHNYPAWRDCLPHGLEYLFPALTEYNAHN